MARIIGFELQTIIQILFQLVAIIVLIAVVVLVVITLATLVKVLKKKSRLLDLEIAEKEKEVYRD